MNKNILIGVIVIVIIAGAFIFKANKKSVPTTQNIQIAPTTSSSVSNQQNQAQVVNITVTTQGFTPQALIIKAGTKVVWTNKSGDVVTVNSAMHPTHLIYPPLNLGQFDNESSVSLVFDKAGTYSYHNHLNPSQTGTITVQ